MSKGQTSAVISIVLSAAIALLAVFGYNVLVVQPQMEALEAQVEGPAGAEGDTNLTNLVLSGDLTVGDDAVISGDLQYGTDSTYPLGSDASGQLYEFGATGAISVTAVTPVAISTVTAFGCNVNSPTGAANKCGAVSSGGTITFTVYNSAVTPVAVVTPHAAGASFWIAGN